MGGKTEAGSFALVVVAGGSGSRMQSKTKKAFLEIAGEPILLHTLRAFRAEPAIRERLVVLPAAELADLAGSKAPVVRLMPVPKGAAPLVHQMAALGVTVLAAGGARRQDSVRNGLLALPANIEFVMIHDAARPFVSPEDLLAVMHRTREAGAAMLAHPVRDTLKRVGPGQNITETVSREGLWAAQTPQCGRLRDLLRAFERHGATDVTDDAAMLALDGIATVAVQGSANNFKITTPEDLLLAEALLARRQQPGADDDQTRIRPRHGSAVFRESSAANTIINLTPAAMQPGEPGAELARAQETRRQGHLEAALVGALAVLDMTPGNAEALQLASDCYDRLGKPEPALRYGREAVAAEPANPRAWVHLAAVLVGAGTPAQAQGALHVARALRLAEQGDTAAAARHRDEALRLDPALREAVAAIAKRQR